MKVLVKSTDVRRDDFVNPNTGKEVTRFIQSAALDTGGDFPLAFDLKVQENKPYPAGEYSISPDSFRCGRYGDLEFNSFNFRLLPLSKSVRNAA